jgi:hypothetical protein
VGDRDPVLDELSRRCHQLLSTRILVVDHEFPSPFSEHRVGRVRMLRHEDYLAVYLDCLTYRFTDDMVYSEHGAVYLMSRWPAVYEVLTILRVDMILDDLSSA